MMIAARESFAAARRDKWRNPYVTDGLVAMWDGEWNAEGGVHNPNAAWTNVCGNWHLDIVSGSGASFGSNCAIFAGTTYYKIREGSDLWTLMTTGRCTIEVVFEQGATSGGVVQFPSTPRGWWIYGNQWNVASTANIRNLPLNTPISGVLQDTEMWKDGVKYGSYNRLSGVLSDGFKVGSGLYTGNFTGKIYALRIYNRKISDAEVEANYAIDKERFNLP